MSGIGIGLGVRAGVIRQTLNVLHEALHRHSSVDVSVKSMARSTSQATRFQAAVGKQI
jgi:hypothetical protein